MPHNSQLAGSSPGRQSKINGKWSYKWSRLHPTKIREKVPVIRRKKFILFMAYSELSECGIYE